MKRKKRREFLKIRGSPALQERGITSLDAVWGAIGREKGIRDLVEATGVDRSQLIEDLRGQASRRAGEKGVTWPRRHALDLLIIAALLVGVGLILRAVPLARAVGIALRDLQQGERLSAEAVHQVANLDPSPGMRLKRAIRNNEYIFSEDLEPAASLKPEQLKGRLAVRLPLEPADVRRLPSLPDRATFAVVAPDAEGRPSASRIFRNVPVLAVEREEGSTFFLVALTDAQIQCLLPVLHDPRVFLLRPPP